MVTGLSTPACQVVNAEKSWRVYALLVFASTLEDLPLHTL